MKLNQEEQAMLRGDYGAAVAEAIDYIIQLGDAFDAEKLVDIVYCHYPAEMGIYKGSVEEAVEFSKTGAKMRVPTTSSTLCADIEKPQLLEALHLHEKYDGMRLGPRILAQE